MVMGLAAVIALPGPPTPCLRPAGRADSAGNPSLEQVPVSFGRAFRQRGVLQRAKDARIIYVIRPILTIDDRAISRLVNPEGRELPAGAHPISLRPSQKLSGHLA